VKFWGIRTDFRGILRLGKRATPGNRNDGFGLSLTVSNNHLACYCESGSIILINGFTGVIRITGRKKGGEWTTPIVLKNHGVPDFVL
jgi:hypothetical protein